MKDHTTPEGYQRLLKPKTNILKLSLEELENILVDWGEAPYRARQVLRWIYRARCSSFAEMSDLPKVLRLRFEENFEIRVPQIAEVKSASDGVKKLLLRLEDGEFIETVIIPAAERLTLCISSQVGCAMKCAFCATARMGLRRNLQADEIVGQILAAARTLPNGQMFTNYVFMGMGEPLANYARVVQAIKTITADWGMGISPRRITVSTVGLVPLIERLLKETNVNLAISLTATTEAQRSTLMPINRRFSLQSLLETCRHLPIKRRDRITFEYVLLKGVNDSIADAKRLTRLLSTLRCKVNLIFFNRFADAPFEPSSREQAQQFQQVLRRAGITATIRESRGTDIAAACGQLRVEYDGMAARLEASQT